MRGDTTRGARTGRFSVRERVLLALLVLTVLGGAPVGRAATNVSFLPGTVMVSPGQYFDLSFRVGASGDSIASFQLYMSFDPNVVELTAATEGSLYAESGHMTWFIQNEVYPGFWHFFDTVFGPGTYVLPPGELVHLRFQALDEGYTQAHIDTIRMTDVRRDPLLVAGYEHGEIFVVPATDVDGVFPSALSVGPAAPNPFSEGTSIAFELPDASLGGRAEIFDLAGRLVRVLPLPDGSRSGSVFWDGKDESGHEVSSTIYFARIAAWGREAATKLVRLR